MTWFLPRALKALVFLALGGLTGFLSGTLVSWPVLATVVGASMGLLVVLWADAQRGERLLEWLRSSHQQAAPRDTGTWGELGYRVERALRSKDLSLIGERQRLEQFLAAIEASPNGVMLLDGSDQIEWCNSIAAQHFGLDPQRDRRQRVTNLVRSPAFVAYLQEGKFDEPVVFTGPQGQATLSVVARSYGAAGDGQGATKLVLSQDITERERADAMRRDFVANVSHEIRTPLTVLSGFVETLAQLPLSEVERRRVLVLMEQQTDRMQALVGDLLTLAQLEGSPRPGADRWLLVSTLLQRAHADAVALSAGRHVITVADAGDAELAGVEAELFSAVGNLVSNAVRYTPEGGQIWIGWTIRDSGEAEVEVRDSGMGISREHIPRLTERFYRVDGSRSRDTGGTGLGLAIVKHVMQRHGGDIDITSESGKGASFKLIFPALRLRSSVSEPAVTRVVLA